MRNDILIRNAKSDDYERVEAIMKQVQRLHVDWRPDIYKQGGTVLPPGVFEEAVGEQTFFVAE